MPLAAACALSALPNTEKCWDFLLRDAIIRFMLKFPQGFLWGAATSAHQVEGNNSYSDWWKYEAEGKIKYPSGQACRHYQLFREDFDIAKSLNHNCHRFSVEWARVQPWQNEFLAQEIKHYQDVVLALKERGIEPVVTLHHFTNPQWLLELGGWENRKSVDYFLAFIEKIVDALSADVRYWVTINEPLIYTHFSYLAGDWPPQKKSLLAAAKVRNHLAQAHIRGYKLIREIYRRKNLIPPLISIASHTQAVTTCRPNLINRLSCASRDWLYNFAFVDRLFRAQTLDYIGINYYSRNLVDVRSWGVDKFFFQACSDNCDPREKNSLGWEVYPEGLYDLLIKFKKYNLPVLVTENGICTDDDSQRWRYIYGHLESAHKALEQGVKVIGYIYWSLLDNFEWDKGFSPRFGLVEVDFRTFERKIRPSALKLAQACRTSTLE